MKRGACETGARRHGSLAGRRWLTSGFPTTRSSPTVPATTRRGCIVSTAMPTGHATRAVLGLDGLWRSGRGRREARASAAHRRLVERRRLLPDERAGTRHGRAVRCRCRLRRDRQRHVRNDPDASERRYPDRVVGSSLSNPDFAALARAFGAHGETVRHTGEFAPAFERALNAGCPALLHVVLDRRR